MTRFNKASGSLRMFQVRLSKLPFDKLRMTATI
jgi:hypothetical protein